VHQGEESGEARFSMLYVLREYALERLETPVSIAQSAKKAWTLAAALNGLGALAYFRGDLALSEAWASAVPGLRPRAG
jgi:hypothetical protein